MPRTLGTCLVAAVVSLGLTVALAPAAAAGARPGEVILFGDSLSGGNQSGPFFNFFVTTGSHRQVVDDVFAGTGPCQWTSQMQAAARSGQVAAVVLAFSGDAFGCESYPVESPSYYHAYQSQVTAAAQMFAQAGIHTFLVGMPMPWNAVVTDDRSWDRLNRIYAQIATSVPSTTFVNAAASVEQDQEFAWTLPCLRFEPSCGPHGQNPVRARDGGHFCPLDPNSVNCGDYESGAVRFALAEAQAVNRYLATGQAPAREGPRLPPAGTPPRLAAGQKDPYTGVRDLLDAGWPLGPGRLMRSLDRRYRLTLQGDGDLVCSGPNGPVWSSGTAGTGATSLVLQPDGNLVLSSPAGPVWSSQTAGSGAFVLGLRDDGQLTLYGPTDAVWTTPEPAASRALARTSRPSRIARLRTG